MPKGSRLGPILFILYINDLSDYLDECCVSQYADDTALYAASASQLHLMMKIQIEISTKSEWMKANKLTLYPAKTKNIVFGSRHKPQDNLI